MTVKELIEKLEKCDPKVSVQIEIQEPYDDDPETLSSPVSYVEQINYLGGKVVILSNHP